jgi:hypothetical protein
MTTTAGGRRLLEHCFTQFGATSETGHEDANHTHSGASDWEATHSVHVDPYTVRLLYWTAHVLFAALMLILMLRLWPPPDRVFPRKRPVCRCLPWCCAGRMLGYGVIDWHEGRLTPFVRYFKERHDLLSLYFGDYDFITFRCRLTHFAAGIVCTAALSMGLTDLATSQITGDFWTHQIWVFLALFVYDIVLGVALRVSAVGTSERAVAATDSNARKKYEWKYFGACALFSLACVFISVMFVHVMDEAGGCGDGFNTFLAYMYIFGLYEMFGWLLLHPAVITFRWVLGRVLLRVGTDAEDDDETMDCCWKKCPGGEKACACRPQPSAPVHAFLLASCSVGRSSSASASNRGGGDGGGGGDDFSFRGGVTPRASDGAAHWDEELGSPRSGSVVSDGMERALGTSRVLFWRRNAAARQKEKAEDAVRAAVRAKKEAETLRTELADAIAAETEAAAAQAQAEAAVAEARALAAEAKALRALMPARRKNAPPIELTPPSPQRFAGGGGGGSGRSSRGARARSPFVRSGSVSTDGGRTPRGAVRRMWDRFRSSPTPGSTGSPSSGGRRAAPAPASATPKTPKTPLGGTPTLVDREVVDPEKLEIQWEETEGGDHGGGERDSPDSPLPANASRRFRKRRDEDEEESP